MAQEISDIKQRLIKHGRIKAGEDFSYDAVLGDPDLIESLVDNWRMFDAVRRKIEFNHDEARDMLLGVPP